MRIDTFAHAECTVPPYYDSMIAKIIVHGRDRQEAIARMRRVLEMTVIEGIKTSVPLHLKILNEADFQAGRLEHGLHGPLHAQAEEDDEPGRERRTDLDRICFPRFTPLSTSTWRRAPGGRRSISRAPISTAARGCCRFAPSSSRPGRSSTLCDALVQAGGALRRVDHRQRPRGSGASWPERPGVHVGQDDLAAG